MDATSFVKPTADGSRTLYSSRYRQTYHSDKGAVTEAKHVFLDASGAAARLERGCETRVLEVGFGTGLNFFLTADLALRCGAGLEYTALERELLPAELVASLDYAAHLSVPPLLERYVVWRGDLPRTANKPYTFSFRSDVRLTLLIGEATEQPLPMAAFHAVYHDAFSPDANPELWDEAFFETLKRALKPNGTLSTYSVKGEVRRRLQRLGFRVDKRPGPPGGKREMLVALNPV